MENEDENSFVFPPQQNFLLLYEHTPSLKHTLTEKQANTYIQQYIHSRHRIRFRCYAIIIEEKLKEEEKKQPLSSVQV